MNTSRAAALSLVLLSPALAFAGAPAPITMTADEAVAAVELAIERAEDAAKVLPNIPVEFAGALVVYPYASEKIESSSNPDAAVIAAALKIKSDYWGAAVAALKTESARLNDEIDEMSRNAYGGIDDAIARSMKLSRALVAVSAILGDIEADAAAVADSALSGQVLLDRKAALCRRLIAQKKPD